MTDTRLPAPLAPDALRRRCDVSLLPFETTAELPATEEIIGQARALKAIRLGLDIPSEGYNIFVVGPIGTGRDTTINRFLEAVPRDGPAPPDLVYVNNFKEPDRPRLLIFPAGRGGQFRSAIHSFVTGLRRHLPGIFESDQYDLERKAVLEGYRDRQRTLLKELEAKVEREQFRLVQIQMGPIVRPSIVPMVEGNPVGLDRLEELVEAGKFEKAEFERIGKRIEVLGEELEHVLKEVRKIDQEAQDRLERLDADVVLPVVHNPLTELRRQYAEKGVSEYLDEVEEDILANLDQFREKGEASEGQGAQPAGPHLDPFTDYRVNLLVDNGATRGAPVLTESAPSHKNLFGAIEKAMDRGGEWHSNFTQIKAGSYLKANGGYLVLNATDVLTEPGVWTALKRTLRTGAIEIQSYDPVFMFTTSVLKPEPIPCSVKVLMLGEHEIYNLLYALDSDFRKIFKVKAEFDTEMRATPDAILDYAGFIRKLQGSEGLLPFDRGGVAAVVESGMRKAGRRSRLSTKFTELADVIREASLLAAKTKAACVSDKHVREALAGRQERVSLVQTRMQELVDEGRILIDAEGAKVGQVNGLSVYDVGDHVFGLPARITASPSMGRAGIVNIERESDLSGPTHNKGVLILTGYLRSLFAQDKPLTLSASLCFEQSYGGVDGDSASCAEMYALLSALAEAPIEQRFAVTGSVNQKGEVQPIGGVNQKIEGWFAVCRARGLTGKQGVLIPVQNLDDLMLDEEVVEAVRAGQFAVYPVAHVDQGIELLTGIPAGSREAGGDFPPDSIYGRVDTRLREMAEKILHFGFPGPAGD